MDKIICGDCLLEIPKLPDRSIDLVVTSPPYNVSEKLYDVYKDNKEHSEYISWLKSVFKALYRKMKNGGRICIVVGDGKNGAVPTHSDIIQFMIKDLKYLLITTIVWDKKNVSNRQSWGSFKSPSCPSFPTPFEYVLVFAKKFRKLQESGKTDLTSQEFIEWSLSTWFLPARAYMENVSVINTGKHQAPLPEDLATRCIKMFSWKEALVLDPFSGYGTVAVAAKKLERKYIAIDVSPKYCQELQERMKNLYVTDSLFENE